MTPETTSTRYFALLYASAAERPALDALLGIEREVFDSVRPGLDHHVAHSRLQWWREECERAARGSAAHPLARALITAMGDPQAKSVPQLTGLCGIVDVAIWDLASATFETRRELDAYCQRWAAAMIEPLVAAAMNAGAPTAAPTPAGSTAGSRVMPSAVGAAVTGATVTGTAVTGAAGTRTAVTGAASADAGGSAALRASAERMAAWHALGAAICEVELLVGLAHDANLGRIRLPLDELEAAGADPATALTKNPWSEPVAALMRSRLTSLRGDIERNVTGLPREQQQALRGLLVWAAISCRAAHRIEQSLPGWLQPGRFDGISDAWFAWRIARRATVGRFRLN